MAVTVISFLNFFQKVVLVSHVVLNKATSAKCGFAWANSVLSMSYLSKQIVRCAYCEWNGRRDLLSRHCSSKHPGKPSRSSDQGALGNFFVKGEGNALVEDSGKTKTEESRITSDDVNSPTRKKSKNSELNASLDTLEGSFDRPGARDCELYEEQYEVPSAENVDAEIVKRSDIVDIKKALNILSDKIDKMQPLKNAANACSTSADDTNVSDIAQSILNAKIRLIRVCKTVKEILQLEPCFSKNASLIRCIHCCRHFSDIPKNIAVVKSPRFGIFENREIETSLGEDEFRSGVRQSREFINLKTHLIDHIKTKAHEWCSNRSMYLEEQEAEVKKEQEKIGLSVARLVYVAIKEGKGGKFFERQLNVSELNDVEIGDINHSCGFFKSFRGELYEVIKEKVCHFLITENAATKKLPLISVTADKITKLHRTLQIVCIVVVVNGKHQCIVLDMEPCGISHKGDNLAAKIVETLYKFNISLDSQLNGMAFDGQYFDLSVDKKILSHCKNMNLEFCLPVWDIAHRIELSLSDVRKKLTWITTQIKTVGDIMKQFKWGISYEELINLADELETKMLNPKSYQETRFVQSEFRLYNTFIADYKLIYTYLHKKRCDSLKEKNNTKAKEYTALLNRFSDVKFCVQLLATRDILNIVTIFSCQAQEVNLNIWEIFDRFDILCKKIEDVVKNLDSEFQNIPEHLSFLKAEFPCLQENIFKECLLNALSEGTETNTEERIKQALSNVKNFCSLVLSCLKTRISEPDNLKHMRNCFSSSNLLTLKSNAEDIKILKADLVILTKWVNDNRNLELDYDVVIEQYFELQKKLIHTINNDDSDVSPENLSKYENLVKETIFTDPDVYNNCHDIVYVYENCLKLPSEAICESIGSVIGNHLHNRNVKAENLSKEVFISWNGPDVHNCETILRSALTQHFKGTTYHFKRISRTSQLKKFVKSSVIDRLRNKEERLDFLCDNH